MAGGGLNWGNQEGRPPFDDSSFKGEYKLSTLSYDGALYSQKHQLYEVLRSALVTIEEHGMHTQE